VQCNEELREREFSTAGLLTRVADGHLGPSTIPGVRLCLGVAADRTELGVALDRIVAAIDPRRRKPAAAVV